MDARQLALYVHPFPGQSSNTEKTRTDNYELQQGLAPLLRTPLATGILM
jgi:hypothetical protein